MGAKTLLLRGLLPHIEQLALSSLTFISFIFIIFQLISASRIKAGEVLPEWRNGSATDL